MPTLSDGAKAWGFPKVHMIVKLAKISIVVFGIAAVTSVFVLASLDNNYVSYPKIPDPLLQKVVAYNVKGAIVYITMTQRRTIALFYYVEIVSLCSIAGIALLTRGKVLDADWPWKRK
jgi:hypothetical protein